MRSTAMQAAMATLPRSVVPRPEVVKLRAEVAELKAKCGELESYLAKFGENLTTLSAIVNEHIHDHRDAIDQSGEEWKQ